MKQIGNSKSSLKLIIFIALPILFIAYRSLSFDYKDNLSGEQQILQKLKHSNQDELIKKVSRDHNIETGIIVFIYLLIGIPLLVVTDQKFKYSKIGMFLSRYIHLEFLEMAKDKDREYEIKQVVHDDKISEIQHKQRMRDIEYLAPLAKINMDNAKTDIEKARAAIMRDAINYMYRMSDRWRAYIFACVNGTGGTEPEDKDLQAETEKIKKDIEYEKWRKENIDNDDRKRKADENKPI